MGHIAFPHFNTVGCAAEGKENLPVDIQPIQQVAQNAINSGVQAANTTALNFVATAAPQKAVGFDAAAMERRITDSIEKRWPLTFLNKQENLNFFCSHVFKDGRTFADLAFDNLHLEALKLLRAHDSLCYKRIYSIILKGLDSYITDRRVDPLNAAEEFVLELFSDDSVEALHFIRYFLKEHKLPPYDLTEKGMAARFYTEFFKTIKTRFFLSNELILKEMDLSRCLKPSLLTRAKWVNISEDSLQSTKSSYYCVIQ